jgi:hypothetical protein
VDWQGVTLYNLLRGVGLVAPRRLSVERGAVKWGFFAVLLISVCKSSIDIPSDRSDSTLSPQTCRPELRWDLCANEFVHALV